MAVAVTSQVFSGATGQRGVYGDAEQSVECGIFRRASASPEFGGADRGVEDQCAELPEFKPLRHQGPVLASRHFYQDVRIGKDGHRSPRRSSLERRRSSSLLPAALARDFRFQRSAALLPYAPPGVRGIAPAPPAEPTRKWS